MRVFQGSLYRLLSDDPIDSSKSTSKNKFYLLFLILFLLLATVTLYSTWPPGRRPFRAPLNETIHNSTEILTVSHVFIVSAYFYRNSKSLGKNAIALNMVIDSANFNISGTTFNVIGSNSTYSQKSIAYTQIEPYVDSCRYDTVIALGNTVDEMKKMELESNGITVEIPFKLARSTAPKPFIICISPQFVAEQWQIFMMHAHVAHQFGGHLHIYLISILESYFELMKYYEQLGYITVDYWLKMRFAAAETPYFEPNAHTMLRNQVGAHTDCLLQYKEAADYVAFFDMDDILIPLNYPTYTEEFIAEWKTHPEASSIAYGRREHEFVKAETMDEFSFRDVVASLRSSDIVKAPKVVVKPKRYNSTGLHFSAHEKEKKRIRKSSPHIIHVQRPIQKHGANEIQEIWKFEFGDFNETISQDDVASIESEIQKIKSSFGAGPSLPKYDYYFPMVFKCYSENIYNRKTYQKCPNAENCRLPQRDDYRCIHSDAEYVSGPHMEPFTFHFSKNSFWSTQIGCHP